MVARAAGSVCRWIDQNGLHSISILLILCFSVAGITGICCSETPLVDGQPVDMGCQMICDMYNIAFNGYDNSQPESMEFRYLVSVESGTCGLRNWVLELPSCVNRDSVLSAGPGSWELVESAGFLGIKFDNGIEQPGLGKPANSVVYYLRLDGPYWSLEEMPKMGAVITAGNEMCQKTVEVPGCPVSR
jgi:hypothetical protein